MKQILVDAMKSSELKFSLEDVIAVDDKVQVEAIPDAQIVAEAKYVLGKFTGESGGFEQEEEFKGEHGPEQQMWARNEVSALKRFLAKYEDMGAIRKKVIPKTPEYGMVVTYKGITYKLSESAGPRRGWFAIRQSDGKRFRFGYKHLRAATIQD